MPLVSVVTATYNRAHLIGETIQHVLNQSFEDFEYIIVDDGSDDNTEAVVLAFSDPRIRFFRIPHKGRLSELRNFCHAKCSGELIAYVDSDDLWKPAKLAIQVQALQENPNAGFSFTDIEVFDAERIIKPRMYSDQGTEVRNVFSSMLHNKLVVCHTTLMLRRSVMELVGENDETFLSGDHDLVFRLSHEVEAIIHHEPLVRVRRHAQNTSNLPDYQRAAFDEHHRTLLKLRDTGKISRREFAHAEQLISYSFGLQSLALGDYDRAFQFFRKSLSRSPLHLKSWFRLGQTLTKKISGI